MQPSHSFPYHFVIVWQFDQSYLSPNCTRVTYQWETVSTRFQTVFDLSRQECRKIVFTTYFKELVDHSNDIPFPPPTRESYWSVLTFPLLEISVSYWLQFFLQMMAPGFKPFILVYRFQQHFLSQGWYGHYLVLLFS